ncbi:MAG: hypothetical protein ABI675_29820 [Chitinophagaceae bacterium]
MDALPTKLLFNLKIVPVTANGVPIPVPFIAMFNPETFTVSEGVCWNTKTPINGSGADAVYVRTMPRSFSLEFTLDGTGVNTGGVKIPVTEQILLFRLVTTKIVAAIHRPAYLMVQYGTFISICSLKSSAVTYTMFDKYGIPIRAKVKADFIERTTKAGSVLNMLSSPDLTHRVQVKEYDLLPELTYKIYNNQDYYLQVAKANRLKNFRKLKPGILVFPPIDVK